MEKEFGNTKNGNPATRQTPSVGNIDTDSKAIRFLGIGLLITCVFAIGVYSGRAFDLTLGTITRPISKTAIFNGDTKGEEAGLTEINFDHYWEVWNMIRAQYVDSDSVSETDMFNASVKGMIDAFGDPATVYLDIEETEAYNKSTSGNFFSGIGAELGYRDGLIVVISPIKGSPAIAAGIRSSDIILAVDDKQITSDMNLYDVVLEIRGEEGTEVTLTVLQQGDTEPKEITIVRGQITIPSMEFELSPDDRNIGVMDVSRFLESSLNGWQDKWDEMVKDYQASGAKGLIIDLRGNPGGYLNGAVYAASEFLPRGAIAAQTEDRNGKVESYTVTRKGKLLDIPVVVLVNEGSASASEIFAGALQKNERATVIGVQTYGKGTAQSIVDFSNGSSLHVTIMKWLLPDGTWLNQENSVIPDIIVEFTDEQFKEGVDPQMEKAVEFLKQEMSR